MCIFGILLGEGVIQVRYYRQGVSRAHVLDELVLSVVLHRAQSAGVGLFLSMTALVVLAIADGGEALLTVLALVGLLTSVGPHMYQEVTLLSKYLATVGFGTFEQVLPRMS